MTLFGATKFNFNKCKDLCPSLTQMQEHMQDPCCKYCDQTFTSRTEKLSHKKYMCKQYKITFSHSVELCIKTHTKIFYMENAIAKVTKQVLVPCSENSKPPPCSDCQALQYKCTKCRQQGEKNNDIINQIKNKHKTI